MKKPLAIRIDAEILAAARECARLDNRSLTNFIETTLRQRIAETKVVEGSPMARIAVARGHARGL